jgi:hypothetical protein
VLSRKPYRPRQSDGFSLAEGVCASAASRRTDAVVMGMGGIDVQPWRQME